MHVLAQVIAELHDMESVSDYISAHFCAFLHQRNRVAVGSPKGAREVGQGGRVNATSGLQQLSHTQRTTDSKCTCTRSNLQPQLHKGPK